MSEWGFFKVEGDLQYEAGVTELVNKFAQYGIAITDDNPYSSITHKIKFSNREDEYSVNLGTGTDAGFLVNDEKNVVLRLDLSLQIPNNTGNITNAAIFKAGILPTMSDDLYVFGWGQLTGEYISSAFNVPDHTNQLDPYANELLLYPTIGMLLSKTNNSSKFFRDLYICLQRQFQPGDIIVSSNGDRYISMGFWFLFKM